MHGKQAMWAGGTVDNGTGKGPCERLGSLKEGHGRGSVSYLFQLFFSSKFSICFFVFSIFFLKLYISLLQLSISTFFQVSS